MANARLVLASKVFLRATASLEVGAGRLMEHSSLPGDLASLPPPQPLWLCAPASPLVVT